MLHQNVNQLLNMCIETFITFCSIAMAFVSNSSPSEDNQSSAETDLNTINTEEEMCIVSTR